MNPQKLLHMLRLETAAEDWFGDLDPKAQLAYLKAHPASKFKPGASHPTHGDTMWRSMQKGAIKHAEHHAILAAQHERKSGDFRQRGQHGTAAVYQQGEIKHRKASEHYRDAADSYMHGDITKGHRHARKGANAATEANKYSEDKRLR